MQTPEQKTDAYKQLRGAFEEWWAEAGDPDRSKAAAWIIFLAGASAQVRFGHHTVLVVGVADPDGFTVHDLGGES